MPLSKRVCQSCLRANAKFPEWVESDEVSWCGGFVSCPIKFRVALVSNYESAPLADVHRPAPNWCPYEVEHVVSEDVHST